MRYTELYEAEAQTYEVDGYTWVKPYSNRDDVVMIDVQKLDASFAQDTEFYVGQNGSQGINGRYARFGEWVKRELPINMPEVSLGPYGHVAFTNGRHRFAWMRDNGVTTLPVAVPPNEADEIKKRFGA